ncbi:MAG: hypothetical protein IT433_13475 [Phycisphaerales bacterium]|nr:hypothetical protein [Phycisphaerales bacterium]
MSWFDPAPTVAYPADMTWQQAMIVLYHYEQGKGTSTRQVSWRTMCEAMYEKHGFVAFDAGTTLREMENPLLLFDPERPMIEHHRLPEGCFRDPRAMYEAVQQAERRHNRLVDEAHAKYKAMLAAGKKVDEPTTPKVTITPLPGDDELDVAGAYGRQGGGLKIGALVESGGAMCEIVAGPDGKPALRRLSLVGGSGQDEPAKPESDTPRPSKPAKKLAATPAAKANGKKGHRVA